MDEWEALAYDAGKYFTPSSPIDENQLFAGRHDQLRQVVDVINQKGQHAIIFGERGVGKTSLANVIAKYIRGKSVFALRKNCDGSDNFSSIWKKITSDILLNDAIKKIGFIDDAAFKTTRLCDYSINEDITPDDVRQMLTILSSRCIPIIIIDEFDRIHEPSTKSIMADTIKTLSDHAISATVIMVGVADSVDQLINEHQSIERSLAQIKMPRMSNGELKMIIDNGLKPLGMAIEEDAKNYIASLSQGLPHYTHSLGLYSTRQAIDFKLKRIKISHVEDAISRALEGAQQTTLNAYHQAIKSSRKDAIFAEVLLASALAETDDLGYFSASNVRKPLRKITRKNYEIAGFSSHLNAFCTTDRGPILNKIGRRHSFKFRFTNPLMQPYIIMQGCSRKLIDRKTLEELKTK
jgi:Cdc6-like AAA superfamily ATPase